MPETCEPGNIPVFIRLDLPLVRWGYASGTGCRSKTATLLSSLAVLKSDANKTRQTAKPALLYKLARRQLPTTALTAPKSPIIRRCEHETTDLQLRQVKFVFLKFAEGFPRLKEDNFKSNQFHCSSGC